MSDATYDALSPSCQQAVDHLRDRCPDAAVLAVHGDWAYVSVGYLDVGRINQVFKQERALGVIRISKNFPDGDRPYGIVTVPYLERLDGKNIERQHRTHVNSEPVAKALNVENLGFWSWRWDGVSHREPSDLKKAPDLIRKRLRMEN